MVDCQICKESREIQSIVKKEFLLGDKSFDDIAIEIEADTGDVEDHCTICLNKPVSINERYRELIRLLEKDMTWARKAMMKSPRTPALQQGYARLVTEYREVVNKSEALKNPEDEVKTIIVDILNPLIRNLLRNVTEELHRLKTEMRSEESIPDTITNRVTSEALKSIANQLKSNYVVAERQLKQHFGVSIEPNNTDEETTIL